MVMTKTTNEQDQWIHRFYQMYSFLRKQDKGEPASFKITELAQKAYKDELTIAFCGHFSAGKSSMINALMDEELLPTSPIPTSANVVTIKNGEPIVRLTDHSGNVQTLAGELDLDTIKQASKNGADIQSIEIHKLHPYLVNSTVIMDTPGIDSVDDAHKVSTESMLHLADVVVYVMDYNHVQSELNFNFTKKMQDAGKKLILVINQIDKHVDDELSFSSFRRSTINGFKQWGVYPVDFYFTSIRDRTNPDNEMGQLQTKLLNIKQHKHDFIERTLTQMSEHLLETYLSTAYPTIEKQQSQVGGFDVLSIELEKVVEEKNNLSSLIEQAEEEFLKALSKGIANARIIPYDVRQLGMHVLESLERNFKTGLLFAKKKTDDERKVRMDRYLQAITKNASTELMWQVKEELFKLLKQLGLTEPELEERIHKITFSFTSEDVLALRQHGATFNEAYILQFNRDVEDSIKRNYRKIALEIVEAIKERFLEKQQPKQNLLDERIRNIEIEKEELDRAAQAVADYKTDQAHLMKCLQAKGTVEEIEGAKRWCEQVADQSPQIETTIASKLVQKNESTNPPLESTEQVHSSTMNEIDPTTIANRLEKAAESLSPWRSMDDLISRMRQHAAKMKSREFTVALFGAFSAGKSSFANAWMKNDVLPVSPNPTTATINKIMPVTDENEHGKVKIKLKTADRLLEEIQHALKRFGIICDTLDEAVKGISKIVTDRPEPHHSFLLAVQIGYDAMREYLGSVQILDHTSFTEFVSLEERACFTESVELYYDCELTRQGITFVDTPGADSINARHTSVAFDYIKNADAIVFVTYYNHAFSKADRDFLLQLGRVKDTFSMDKMYFVINAADLATDAAERADVVKYVESQLVEYGIRHPRMSAVSSKQALIERKENKTSGSSQFDTFEQSFQTNTIQERDSIAQQQAAQLLKTGLDRVDEWIVRAQTDEKQREQEIEKLRSEKDTIVREIRSFSFASFEQAIQQEAEELLHYVVQRLMLTINDEFKMAFNPSVITKDMKREQLTLCLDELLTRMAFQLDQELRATSLRLERFVNVQRQRFFESVAEFTSEKASRVRLLAPDDAKLSTPDISSEWPNDAVIVLQPALKGFKSPKHFFENTGKDEVRESLIEQFRPMLEASIESYTEKFSKHYLHALNEEESKLRQAFETTVEQYYQGVLEAFTSDQLEDLDETKVILNELVAEQEGVISES
ncbi:dynamin family protein [Alkalihalobacillus sp. AL-G]|uniref:dynamin family protein n=1 Tax=Alkalihalobacillus sp. AL-G TaxID=2926399 RepID=UPI00272C253E|nr:dynamin family protein [Alkalihalobacillus sp. AL-G]WLD95289.1 dynamin family protein [Alkalihalobacillus sp. AL-G]